MSIKKFQFADYIFITGSFDETAEWLAGLAQREGEAQSVITHLNVYNYHLLKKNGELKRYITENNHIIFDGIGMKIGAWLNGLGWLPDLNGTDLFPMVMDLTNKNKISIFILGGNDEAARSASEKILERWPGIGIAGYKNGYFTNEEETKIVAGINAVEPDILINSRGFLPQEDFIKRNREKLQVSLIWNTGGLVDFISGTKPRAPLWMRTLRMEWLFRFMIEPGRMFYRNFIVTPLFLFEMNYKGIGKKLNKRGGQDHK